jgi:leucyl aminopeptidase
MALKVSLSSAASKNNPLVAFAFEKETAPLALPQAKNLISEAAAEGFKGKEGSAVVLRPKSGSPAKWVVLVGLGDRTKFNPEVLRRAAAAGLRKARRSDEPRTEDEDKTKVLLLSKLLQK